MEFSVEQIAGLLNGTVVGDGSLTVTSLSNIEAGVAGTISFLSNPKYEPHIYTTKSTAVIVKKDFEAKQKVNTNLILVDDPYLSFTTLLETYHKITSFQKKGKEEPSFVATNATVGTDVYQGAFSYIGAGSKVGNNVKIYPNAYIGDNVQIGDNTIIFAGVKIYGNVSIGAHCVIQSGAVIGSDGFGFAPQADGTYKTIPQVGKVIIEDHVDVGANTVIDRATFESTVIKKGVKLDNLIQIAHNVELGENTVVAAQTGISGSTKVGKNVIVAGQVGIVGHIKIADKTIIGAQAGIGKNTISGKTYLGSPGYEIGDYMKSYVVFKKLPDLMKRIQELEQKLVNLPLS
jgi:UDP-3-O-[3-hydroxymyristoyl] glucosamine N-acyltransferase